MSLSSPDEATTQLGNAIKVARKRLRLTQKELAERLGVADATIGRWERDEVWPQKHLWTNLAEILGARIAALLGVRPTGSMAEIVEFPATGQPDRSPSQTDLARLTEAIFVGIESGSATSESWFASVRAVAYLKGIELSDNRPLHP